MAGTIERERKWLVTGPIPPLDPGTVIRQGYLALDGDVEVRARQKGDRYVVTIKAGRPPSRTEVERDLDADEFDSLWAATAGRRVEKVRHRLELDDGLVAEVDVFAGALDGLVLVEVEFPDDEALEAFEPPTWFGADVTTSGGYGNAELAVHGLPG